MIRLLVSASLLAGIFNCSATSKLSMPLSEVVRIGDSSNKVLLVGDLFAEFEKDAGHTLDSPKRFSDVFPDVTLAELGTLNLVTAQKPNEIDYRVFEGAQIESLRIVTRPCADYIDPAGLRLGLGTCDKPRMAVLTTKQLIELKSAKRIGSVALHLPDQEVSDAFIEALESFVVRHQPKSIGYGFAMPFCDIPSDINTVGLGITLEDQSPKTIELLLQAAGSAAISEHDLIDAAREQGIAVTDDATAIISETRNFISFKNDGVTALRSLQQENCKQ